MSNQIDYPDQVLSNIPPASAADITSRPDRIEINDLYLIVQDTAKSVVFGTTNNDIIELHLYDLNNNYLQTQYIYPTDPSLSITKVVDEINSTEVDFLNIDLQSAFISMGILPGRYLTTFNFFRNEVGSDFGERLYISDISPSRTEVKLEAIQITNTILQQLYEFIAPSVPRIVAQGLVDQLFSQSLNYTVDESIQSDKVNNELVANYTDTENRLTYAGLNDIFSQFVDLSMKIIDKKILDDMAQNPLDYRIQQPEIESFIYDGIGEALIQMQQQGLLDNRLELI